MRKTPLLWVAVSGLAICSFTPGQTRAAELIRLANFNGVNGDAPYAGLVADANGNLFGATSLGGTNNDGAVFEIGKTGDGYAKAPKVLVSFNNASGSWPFAPLLLDADGNLFGTTSEGGPNKGGAVFEIAKTGEGYASAPTILAVFKGANGAKPVAPLIMDAKGNLYGTTSAGGEHNYGTVFEILKTANGYESAPRTLISFTGANGSEPSGGLLAQADSQGHAMTLYGTTLKGGKNNLGTVFRTQAAGDGYANQPYTLVTFTGANGAYPRGGLVADANGNLFGTTIGPRDGTVFELVKTGDRYASAPTTLVNFNPFQSAKGREPYAGLIIDAKGNLFGTATGGGPNRPGDVGTVFEVAKTPAGYAAIPIVVVGFRGRETGFDPVGGLMADASGNLFGTTKQGGELPVTAGTVFEIAGSGFVPSPVK